MPSKKPPSWPPDDQVREREGDREFTDDGRKVNHSERVGGLAPDADPDRSPPRPRHRSRR